MLRFALVYVHETDGVQKHVMRYPQLFATKAIEKKLSAGIKKGIIWHTQGSGKTALAYYNTRFLPTTSSAEASSRSSTSSLTGLTWPHKRSVSFPAGGW